jgi:hypothetical protein
MTTVSRLENPGKETFEMAQHKIQALMEKVKNDVRYKTTSYTS